MDKIWELTKIFRLEAAHALSGTALRAASEDIHGHSFLAEVSLHGTSDPVTGIVIDPGLPQRAIEDVRLTLDDKFRRKIEMLGTPKLESLSRYIWERLTNLGGLTRVSSIHRDTCTRAAPTRVRRADCS
jgi:6-pyruvoyltetrahydropterin/6-carboxytetrahydropterin synthase